MTLKKLILNHTKLQGSITQMEKLIDEQKVERAKDLAHSFSLDEISYNKYRELLDLNEKSYNYLKFELKELFNYKRFSELK